jgi:transcriptional regulator NrdR family protein
MEKNRRYQKKYRKEHPPGSISKKSTQEKSVAESDGKHLAKFKAVKYKRRCLKCRKKFTGIGKYNRVCGSCTIENSRTKPLVGG